MRKFSSKRIANLGLFTAIALIMFMVESLFPPLFIPGAKLGISNIITLLVLVVMSPIDAMIVVVVRTVIGSMFFGSLSTLIYSLTAGVIALLISIILYKCVFPKISLVAISTFSAVIHNIIQNLVFCMITSNFALIVYSPYLALIGCVAGIGVGVAVELLLKAMPEQILIKIKGQ